MDYFRFLPTHRCYRIMTLIILNHLLQHPTFIIFYMPLFNHLSMIPTCTECLKRNNKSYGKFFKQTNLSFWHPKVRFTANRSKTTNLHRRVFGFCIGFECSQSFVKILKFIKQQLKNNFKFNLYHNFLARR